MEHTTYILTSESVTTGHPDKLCDQISDAILDAFLASDAQARVACEAFAMKGKILVAGEFRTGSESFFRRLQDEAPAIVLGVLRDAGYGDERLDIDPEECEVEIRFNHQSPDIAQAVDGGEDTGAGDQGMTIGYACTDTREFMPLPLALARKLTELLTLCRRDGRVSGLRPDGKSQVSVRYVDGKPREVTAIVLSSQHDGELDLENLRRDLLREVIDPVIPAALRAPDCRVLIKPGGKFGVGGPLGDTGLTGRKIIGDTYGGACPHGGGAFSGKDGSKVDRSGAYLARHLARTVVAAGCAERCTVRLSWAIGESQPLDVDVHTHGTGMYPENRIAEALAGCFDMSPAAMIRRYGLDHPRFLDTARNGHFGRPELPWESTEGVERFRGILERLCAAMPAVHAGVEA